ncbi:MAG TPA: adenylosuccinate synthetase [Gaiellaceae bacterium]|jgi:adenylosuccinate synthase|nr:adenylosuccinate synthetase [Gaiellaceae bacterium]
MSVTVVVGGQFGSEGKGKVAQYASAAPDVAAAIRVGGSNSGHTAICRDGTPVVLRHLPTAAVLPEVLCLLAPGTYLDVSVLLDEIARVALDPRRLVIDPKAFVITGADRAAEAAGDLGAQIGSTNSGTGAAVARRIARSGDSRLARDIPELQPFIQETNPLMRQLLGRRKRVVVEGTQGFGLSLLHSPHYPFTTTRDTTAAGAVAEAGLSPRDVDEIYLVIRAFPIRVAGSSGPLQHETTWEDVTEMSGASEPLAEYTSVTGRIRRVARFDPAIVQAAISHNQPTAVFMNHVDYIDAECGRRGELTETGREFVINAATSIGRSIDYVGVGRAPEFLPGRVSLTALAS